MPNTLTTQENPFFQKPKNKFQVVEFSQLRLEHYVPALDKAIGDAKAAVEKIKNNPAAADFPNTIDALEYSSELVDVVAETYFNLLSAEADEEFHKLAAEMSQKLSQYSSDVLLDAKLFARVNQVYQNRSNLKLNTEQSELLYKSFRSFVRNGALLNEDKKQRLRKLDEELAMLGPKFSENVLKSTNAFELLISDVTELSGLPEMALEQAKEAAQAKGKTGWLINLQAPSVIPVLTYCDSRNMREKIWRAYNSRSLTDSFDNRPILKKIIRLRHERAHLLGYSSHAHFVLEERMATEPNKVQSFLKSILGVSKQAAQREFNELREFKKKLTGDTDLKAWDYAYYAEKLKQDLLKFDEEELRPYFQLEKVIEGVFTVAGKLYGLKFTELDGLPKYHSDVKCYEVTDSKTQKHMGVFYADFFPRETKKAGAWMTNFRDQGFINGKDERPIVSIVCNFTKPTSSKPSLLTLEEVKTLFHEFGHALHSLLSECHYRSLAGPKVYWDFVELPSQIMENWVMEKETLDLFAVHYKTGEKIPADYIQKIKDANKFHAGWFSLRQVNFAMLDLAWHSGALNEDLDVERFEEEVTRSSSFFPKEPGTAISTSFAHIFAGGYSAGYYSYKWAEVLDADAFEYFLEKGLFNQEVSQKFRFEVLAKGGSEHPMVLYKKFRGREPDPNALFRREGLM